MYQIFKDFAGPVATIIAAFAAVSVTGYFACQQAAIARDKLEHDVFYRLYDRRVAVYEATRKFLADVFHGNITEDDIQAYGLLTLDAQFLFDEELYLYLKEIRQRVAAWRQAKWLSELEPPSAEKGAFADIARLHQLRGLSGAKPLKSLGRHIKSRHYMGERSRDFLDVSSHDFRRRLSRQFELQLSKQER